jgi:hypothetical protein
MHRCGVTSKGAIKSRFSFWLKRQGEYFPPAVFAPVGGSVELKATGMNDPFRSPVLRLGIAYVIGLNVCGLVSALSFVVLVSRFGQESPVS